MGRTKFSQAIHRSIRKQVLQFKEQGAIGKEHPKSLKDAVDLACKNAYSRVRTEPQKGDVPPR